MPTIVTAIPQSPASDKERSQDSLPDTSSNASSVPSVTTVIRNVNGETTVEITRPRKEEPKYVEGMLALCQYCGYTSSDFNCCQRCTRSLPDNVKALPSQGVTGLPAGTKEKRFHDKYKKWEAQVSKTGAKKPSKRPVKKPTKLVDEPVCLTLSSDEEERGHCEGEGSQRGSGQSAVQMGSGVDLNCDLSSSLLRKEPPPSFSDEEEELVSDISKLKSVCGGGREMQSIVDGSMVGTYTLLDCRTVRIGNYKVVPKDRVLLSSAGIRIQVPSLTDDSSVVTVAMERSELRKVLINFGRGMPVLFLYTNRVAAERIRRTLGMEPSRGPYYDPNSLDDTQRRITLLPERIAEESKVALKSIFEGILSELDNKEANELLVRASPREIQSLIKKATSGSSNSIRIKNEIQTIIIYPPPPAKGGIPINTEDYACLGEDQFLNDVIIDFYLKFLTLSSLTPDDQARTHVFSSFFYKRLTTRPAKVSKRPHPIEDDPKLSPAEKRHSRVKGWTKHVNIFEKDFIIIPINEHCHWFLAIICFPGLTGCVRMSDNTPVKELPKPRRKTVTQKNLVEEAGKSVQIGCTTITPVKVATTTITLESPEDDCSDRDEAEGEDDDIVRSSSEEDEETSSKPAVPVKHALFADSSVDPFFPSKKSESKNSVKTTREPIKQPCILIFDSLSGASRTRVVATLRDYLRIEYRAKMGRSRDFSKDTIKGASPRVPQQTNFTDCGLYLLQYVESFFMNPIDDYHLPMKKLADWFPEEVVSRKREDIQKLLLDLMQKYNVDIDSLNLPKLSFSSSKQNSDSCDANDQENSADDEREISGSPRTPPKLQQLQQHMESEAEIMVARPLVSYADSDGEMAPVETEQERTDLASANFVDSTVPVLHKGKRIGTERRDPVDSSAVTNPVKRMRPAR